MDGFAGAWFNLSRGLLAVVGLTWLGFAAWLLQRAVVFPDPTFGRVLATVAVGALLWAVLHLVAAWRARADSGWGRATGLSLGVLGSLLALVLIAGGLSSPLPGWMAAIGLLTGVAYGLVLAGFSLGGSSRLLR